MTPWTAARQASPSFTISQSFLKLTSTESVMPSNHLILSSHLQSFPASESFPMSQFFTSDGQSIGVSASASVLQMNIQSWFPLGLTSLISLLSEGLSRVSFSTTVWNDQFFSTQPYLWSSSHIKHMSVQRPIGECLGPVQSLSCVWLFASQWTAARQASLSITKPWSLLRLMSIESVMPSNHLILCHPLLLSPSIFPSIGVFSFF